MLLSLKKISKFNIQATDGSIGKASRFLFDDNGWIIRYLVVDTGNWLPGRKVLIAPQAIDRPSGQKHVLPVNLTKDQIKNSPDLSTEMPVSRKYEKELFKYYNWTTYWRGIAGPVTAPGQNPAPVTRELIKQDVENEVEEKKGNNLRDTKVVTSYTIHAEDGEMGHIDDLIVDTGHWRIKYMVVDTKKWLPSKKVLIPSDWIKNISWVDSEASVDVKKAAVKDSPEFNPNEPVNQEYEGKLYDYYGREHAQNK